MVNTKADVCLVLEGTYPYISGGVSTWTHELIKAQKHLSFHIAAILPPNGKTDFCYKLPDNVISTTNIYLQKVQKGSRFPHKSSDMLFRELEIPLLNMQTHASMKQLKKIDNIIKDFEKKHKKTIGRRVLLDSDESWKMLLRMYHSTMGNVCFLDYFWSWRALLSGIYSMLLAPLPEADVYHALCTGYAGLYLARAHLETNKPCLLTEHGIYTNERRIEIASADWLDDQKALDFNISRTMEDRNLRDFWIDTFTGYSKVCYEVSKHIITLYEGNQQFQIEDGANAEKLRIIPNGIDYEFFSSIEKKPHKRPTIALIGRVVPIKDIKTFIRVCSILAENIPDLLAYVMGPKDEDEEYYEECLEMTEHFNLKGVINFTGMVKIADYLGEIDVLVLTSISEAQPLVILEGGALGIPSVATDVGACREIIFGRKDEEPLLGAGGAIGSLSNPKIIAEEIDLLLTDKQYYESCSTAIQKRVYKYYNKKDQHSSYKKLYDEMS